MGRENDGLETARADFVDGGCIRSNRHASAECDLSCGGLANASLYNVTKEDLLYGRGVNVGLLEGTLEGNDAEFGCGEGLEGTIEGADRGTGSSNNNDFVGSVIRLFAEGLDTAIQEELGPAYH